MIKLNKAQLQFVAVIAMTIAHFCFLFSNIPVLYYSTFAVGRITVIIMSFFVAEGYYKTHDLKRYILRMAIFAAISQIPFYLFDTASIPTSFRSFVGGNIYHMNVIYTLLIGLIALAAIKSKLHITVKLLSVIICLLLVKYSDWRYVPVLLIISAGLFPEKCRIQLLLFAFVILIKCIERAYGLALDFLDDRIIDGHNFIMFICQFASFFALPFLAAYNGEKGNMPRLGFYIFYPLHLLIAGLMKLFLF